MAEITRRALKGALTDVIKYTGVLYKAAGQWDDLVESGEQWQEYCEWKAALAALERGEEVKIVP